MDTDFEDFVDDETNTKQKAKYRRGHLAALIRRKMTSRDHGDKKKYDRKNKDWRGESPSLYLSYVH